MVLEINPLMGIQEKGIGMHDVYSVHDDETEARRIAVEAYKAYCDEALQLEEKKGKVGDKLKKVIDQLEKKRKEHVDMAKEDPKNASKHKEGIAKIAGQIDDLMTKMEKIEKSKKQIAKAEDKKEK
jgi:methyl-accepting chemotaxis protein